MLILLLSVVSCNKSIKGQQSSLLPSSTKEKLAEMTKNVNANNARMWPTVALLTDFGDTDAAATCHQMIKRVNRFVDIVDMNHNINPFNVEQASVILQRSKDFPDKTVFVSVVDPGVGTNRKSIILKAKSRELYFVGPNNGIFTDVATMYGIDEIYEIDPIKVNPKWAGWSFDGRDLYSPTGAIVATLGAKVLPEIGKKLSQDQFIKLDVASRVVQNGKSIKLKIIAIDEPYGNLWTEVLQSNLKSIGIDFDDKVSISTTKGKFIADAKFVHAFAAVAKGANLAYLDSRNGIGDGYLALGVNQGDFRKKYHLDTGDFVVIRKK